MTHSTGPKFDSTPNERKYVFLRTFWVSFTWRTHLMQKDQNFPNHVKQGWVVALTAPLLPTALPRARWITLSVVSTAFNVGHFFLYHTKPYNYLSTLPHSVLPYHKLTCILFLTLPLCTIYLIFTPRYHVVNHPSFAVSLLHSISRIALLLCNCLL